MVAEALLQNSAQPSAECTHETSCHTAFLVPQQYNPTVSSTAICVNHAFCCSFRRRGMPSFAAAADFAAIAAPARASLRPRRTGPRGVLTAGADTDCDAITAEPGFFRAAFTTAGLAFKRTAAGADAAALCRRPVRRGTAWAAGGAADCAAPVARSGTFVMRLTLPIGACVVTIKMIMIRFACGLLLWPSLQKAGCGN